MTSVSEVLRPAARQRSDELLLHAIVAMVAMGMAALGAYEHFVMLERFVVYITVMFVAVALGEIRFRTFERSSRTAVSLILLGYIALYVIRLRPGVAAAMGYHHSAEYYELFALIAYFTLMNAAIALRNPAYLQTLMLWFVGCSIVLELSMFLAGVNVISNPNIYSYLLFASVPFIHSSLASKPRLATVVLVLLAAATMLLFKSRSVFLAFAIYGFVFVFWRQISATRTTFALFFVSFGLGIVVFLYFYIFKSSVLEANAVLQASNKLTDKQAFGRLPVWIDLVGRIAQSPIWGHCSNCNTEFFTTDDGSRNLSSHSTYLELLYRGGIVGLTIYLALLVALIRAFRRFKSNTYAVMGVAYIIASMFISSVYEFTMFSFISVNLLFWIAIGLLMNLANRAEAQRQAGGAS
jgi:O-antigen ligase